MELSQDDYKILECLETDLWRTAVRHDRQRMDEVFAADFFEFGRSGRVYSRAQLIATNGEPIDAVLPLPEFRARLITSEVAQVTYNSVVTDRGEVLYGRRSSIWSRESGSWKLRFHQGTPYSGEG